MFFRGFFFVCVCVFFFFLFFFSEKKPLIRKLVDTDGAKRQRIIILSLDLTRSKHWKDG